MVNLGPTGPRSDGGGFFAMSPRRYRRAQLRVRWIPGDTDAVPGRGAWEAGLDITDGLRSVHDWNRGDEGGTLGMEFWGDSADTLRLAGFAAEMVGHARGRIILCPAGDAPGALCEVWLVVLTSRSAMPAYAPGGGYIVLEFRALAPPRDWVVPAPVEAVS